MSLHPPFALSSSVAPQAQALADTESNRSIHYQRQSTANWNGLAPKDPRLLFDSAISSPSSLIHMLSLGSEGPLANFNPTDTAGSTAKYFGPLPKWFREFVHYDLTAGDAIAVLAARGSVSSAMGVLVYAQQLGITALGAALVPRSVIDHAEFRGPTVSEALGMLRSLALPPEYHSVATGALLRWPIVCFSKNTVFLKVAEYMESCGIQRAPTLDMYAALCRRDGHALVSCQGLPFVVDELTVYGLGDAPSDLDASHVLKAGFKSAIESRQVLRAVAIAERLLADPWAYAKIAHFPLHTYTTPSIDALCLVLDLAKKTLTEDETVVFFRRALSRDFSDSVAQMLVEHSGIGPHLLCWAMLTPISLAGFKEASLTDLYVARIAASTPADASSSALARRQASLFNACRAIDDINALGLLLADASFTGGAEILFVLLIHAIESKEYGGLETILSHPKFTGAPGFHHAVYKACTRAISFNSSDALGNILNACKPHSIVGILCNLIVTVSSFLYDLCHLECVASFFPSELQRGTHSLSRLSKALKEAFKSNRFICAWSKITCLAKTAHLCKIDVHNEVVALIHEPYIMIRYYKAETIADIFPYFGEHAHAVAISMYRQALYRFNLTSYAFLRLRDACPPIPLADRLAWTVDSLYWRIAFPELTDNDVYELFMERCKLPHDEKDWTASAVQHVRLRVSQRKRAIAAYRAQCFRKILSLDKDYFVVADSAQLPADGANCPLCFEEISETAVGANDPLSNFTSMTTFPAAESESAFCHCDCREAKESIELFPTMYALRKEAEEMLANVATDLAPVAAKCPGKHLAHRECMRAWFARRTACPVCSFHF